MERRVYAITGVSPEVAAYGMAKYSRSAQSMEESLREISEQRAAEFLDTFYFQYGHRSIADMAHVALAIEQVSIWAAMVIEDEPLWDGQERSTRYQDFKKTGYHTPAGAPIDFTEIADALFGRYRDLTKVVFSALCERYPRPDHLDEDTYRRTLRARAFDVGRYWLPLATRTSLGQVTSARVLERQISRLFSHPLPELHDIAADMREAAVSRRPLNLLETRAKPSGQAGETLSEMLDLGPVAPTLAKYTAPNPYLQTVPSRLAALAGQYLGGLVPDNGKAVHLTVAPAPLDHACTALLYSVSNLAYHQIAAVVAGLGRKEKEEILAEAFRDRGRHDEWLRELQAGPLVYDVLMDVGSFRDLNRHRRATKIVQKLTVTHGGEVPAPLVELGLADGYTGDMAEIYTRIQRLQAEWDPWQSLYLLPFATRCRTLFQMDAAQAAYMAELRTGPAGHFSYREIAYQMYECLAEQLPELARYVRVTNPREVYDPFLR